MQVTAYSKRGNVVGTVEVGEKLHSSKKYSYKVYGEFTPIKTFDNKEKKNG